MNSERLIFLDIDGVLNSAQYFRETDVNRTHWSSMIDPLAVKRLNDIVARTGAKVVISSSWRALHSVDEIRSFLNERGFIGEVVGRTPTHREYVGDPLTDDRGHYIQQWINENKFDGDFVIIDDDRDVEPYRDRWVHTTWERGLEQKHVVEAMDLFGVEM